MGDNIVNVFKSWVPKRPTVLTRTKNFVELSFEQPEQLSDDFKNALLYKVQTKTKMLGWVNVYSGGKSTKNIDNLQPGRPHIFRVRVILRSSKLSYLNAFNAKIIENINDQAINLHKYEDDQTQFDNSQEPTPSKKYFNKLNEMETCNTNPHSADDSKETYMNSYSEIKLNDVNIKTNNEIESEHINDAKKEKNTNDLDIPNNVTKNQWIESQWSEEISTCTEPEGPTVVCFCMAVRCGYMKQVQSMLEERPELIGICNTTDGFTPLATAVRKGNMQMTKYLLSVGADVNQLSTTSQSPLHLALYSANISLTELLLERGADIKCRDLNGLSPLHYAVDSGDLATLIHALQSADLNARDNKGWTALHRAVIQGADAAIVQELVDRGSDPEARDHRGLNCAQLAALLTRREDIQRIVDKNFLHEKAVINFTKLTKKLTSIHTLTHK